jgi:hypothetical protein
VQFADPDFDAFSVRQLDNFPLVSLLQENGVTVFNEFTNARYFVNDGLERVDYITDRIENLDNDDDAVDHGDRKPDPGRSFRDLRRAARLELQRQILNEANYRPPGIKETLDKIPDLCYRAFNINNSLLKPKVFFEALDRLDLCLKRIKQVDAGVERACEMLNDLLTEIEQLLQDRKLLEQELEKLIQSQASDEPV